MTTSLIPIIWILIFIVLPVYFIPSFVASQYQHRQLLPIFLLNLFLGWSLLGWVAALVWATMNECESARQGQQ